MADRYNIKYTDIPIGDITIGSAGYVSIASWTNTVHYYIIFVIVYRQYNTCAALTVNGYGEYIVGPAGFKASNVSLRYFYKT